MAALHNKPVFHLIHNTHPYASIIDAEKPQFIVYNSEYSRDLLDYKHESIVVHPPVDYRHYDTTINHSKMSEYREEVKRDAITLINLNENKGADIFFRLAEMFPERRFIGVQGSYDKQLTGRILKVKETRIDAAETVHREVVEMAPTPKNVEIWPKQVDIRTVYRQTRILLMPSRYESYGRTGPEAMSSGIPVICTSVFGLMESCGKAGIYIQQRDNIDEWARAIKKLDPKAEYDKASKKAKERAKELDPGKELDALWEWVREKRSNW